MILETNNLKLISCDKEILTFAIEANKQLSNKINVTVPDNWTEFGVVALQYALDKLVNSEDEASWWTYLPVYKLNNTLIGSGGYKGKPTSDGIVEIGYEIVPQYRNRGFATEMTKALIANAFNYKSVKLIIAHTLGYENPSTKVLQKCGFVKVEQINDPEDGIIWKWELKR